jgi:hypothetical protein
MYNFHNNFLLKATDDGIKFLIPLKPMDELDRTTSYPITNHGGPVITAPSA